MAATLNITQEVSGTVKGARLLVGSKSTPVVLTLSEDNYSDEVQTLANNTSYLAWDAGATDPVTSFGLLVILPTEDLLVELTCDKGADVGTEQLVIKVKADIPFILSSDYSIANYTDSFGGGTADVIDRVRVRNESGSSNDVRIIVAK